VLALDRTPASTVSLLLNLELVATVLIARLFLHEQIGRRAALGIIAVAASGIVLAGGPDAAWAGGALLVAGACLCWGVDNAITASLDAWSPAQITLVKGVVAGTVNLTIGMAIAGVPAAGPAIGALAVGALGYGLSITMWITGARQLGAARGQAVFALAPFIGAALSWAVHDDDLGASFAIAFAMSLAGVLIVATAQHGHEHHHHRLEHAHPIDPDDPHHAPAAIEMLGEQQHRHLELSHTHEHLPDLHHRHDH
jgi:drug/metabolite transporter (DMT)-like permease